MDCELSALLADEDRLRAAMQEADTVPLAMVLVHLSDDLSVLDELAPFVRGPWDYSNEIAPELEQDIRERLVLAVKDRAAAGRGLPPLPDDDVLQRMMSIAVGEPVSADYVPMMLEDMALRDGNPRQVAWRNRPSEQALAGFRVGIIGAGMSGICAAIHLLQANIPFVVFEKNETVGGTWYENRYPGAGVDSPNHFYSYSFEPNHDWPAFYSKREELHAYFERCADQYKVRRHIRFRTEVQDARYDACRAVWRVTVTTPTGGRETHHVNALISAVGQLNRPKIPDIPGLDDFEGTVVHSARWPEDLDVSGRRVAMIGTGASGMQVGPTIAPDVERLTIFQRSPHWSVFNANYHRQVANGKKWILKHLPYYAKWYRFTLFWGFSDGIHDSLKIDPTWHDSARTLNEVNARHRINIERALEKELGERPDLMAKVLPDYPPYGKRMLVDNHWCAMLKRGNVDLVTTPISGIEAAGIRMHDGTLHEADIIVFATGFHAERMLWPMEIYGADGERLRDRWGDDDPRAFLGMTVPGYPNLFLLYGPNTNLAHGGSIIFHTECQLRYIMGCLREMLENGLSFMDVRTDVHDAYNRDVDAAHDQMVWTHPGVDNWYRNPRGRVFANSPWRLVDYWRMTAEPDLDDFRVG